MGVVVFAVAAVAMLFLATVKYTTTDGDMIKEFTPDQALLDTVQARITSGELTKFTDVNDFIKTVQKTLADIHIPYKVSLYTDTKREINFGILQTIVNQLINC